MASDCIDLTKDIVTNLGSEFETNLIQAVKQQSCLYVKNHPQYEKKLHNDIAWLRISNKLQTSTIDCINAWYSLLQTFLYFSRLEAKGDVTNALKWPHYKTLKEMKPQMVDKYVEVLKVEYNGQAYPKITTTQQEKLLQLMELYGKELMSVQTSNAKRQEIWTDISNTLNAMKIGIPMPVIRWQKVWWDLKRGVGIRKKLEMKGINVNKVGNFETKDLRILKICALSPTDEEQIKVGLESYIEIDVDTDHSICKQCSTLQDGNGTKDLCENCSKRDVGTCDICSKAPFSNVCNTTNWSLTAKQLIPVSCRNKSKLSICQVCQTTLKRKASLAWKICRICAKESENLENFLCSSFQHVRDVFRSATKFTFCITDGLPCFACPKCLEQLLEFNKFYVNFNSAQVLLQEIHEKNFIGEGLNEAPPQKAPDKSSNKRSRCSQDTPTSVAEEIAVKACKRIRLSEAKVSAICEVPKQQGTSVLRSNLQDVAQKSKSKDSNAENLTSIFCNTNAGIINNLNQPRPPELHRLPWTTNVPVEFISPPNALTKAQIADTFGVMKVSDLDQPNAALSFISNTPNMNQSNFTASQRLSLPSPEISISKIPSFDQLSVSLSSGFSQSIGAAPSRDKSNVYNSNEVSITKVTELSEPSSAAHQNASLSSRITDVSINERKTSNLGEISIALSSSPKIDPGSLKITSLTPPNVTKSKKQQPQILPAVSFVQQTHKPMTFIPLSSPLRKSTMNPLLQGLLNNRPALHVTHSSSQQTPTSSSVAHFRSLQILRSQIGLSSSSTAKMVETEKSTKSVPSTKQPLSDSTTEKAPRKPPLRRMTIHHFSPPKTTERTRKTSLEGEVIIIRDDTPPREVQPSLDSTEIQVDLGSAISNLNPLMFYPDSIDLVETLLDTDIALSESLRVNNVRHEEEDGVVNDERLEFISPSLLIDFAVNKAFRRDTPTPQRSGQLPIDKGSVSNISENLSKKDTVAYNKKGSIKQNSILDNSESDNTPSSNQEQGDGTKNISGKKCDNILLKNKSNNTLTSSQELGNEDKKRRGRPKTNPLKPKRPEKPLVESKPINYAAMSLRSRKPTNKTIKHNF